jgi:hypothetical protein
VGVKVVFILRDAMRWINVIVHIHNCCASLKII